MAVGCSGKTAKALLFVFNLLVFIAGIATLATGIWMLADDSAMEKLEAVHNSETRLRTAAILLIVVGALTAIISFFGCFGAIKESSCLLVTFAVILSVILVAQIVGGILAIIFKNDIGDGFEKSMNETVQEKYAQSDYEEETKSWDVLQIDLKCCGSQSYKDWATSKWKNNNASISIVPKTCCVLKNDNPDDPKPKDYVACNAEAALPKGGSNLYRQGCDPALTNWFKQNADIIIGVAFGLAIVLLLGIICACVLKSNKHGEYTHV